MTLDLSGAPSVASALEKLGIVAEEGLLYLQREVFAEGKSQARINGRPAPLSVMREVGRQWIDLHGQHEHQGLIHSENHVRYLDAWIGAPAELTLRKVAESHSNCQSLRMRLEGIRMNRREREQQLDLLRYQRQEIESAAPRTGEFEELQARLRKLQSIASVKENSEAALARLIEADESAHDQLAKALALVETIADTDPQLKEAAEMLQSAMASVQEASRAIRGATEEGDLDPAAVEHVAARLDLLRRLRSKYGDEESEVLAHLVRVRERLSQLEFDETDEPAIEAALAESLAQLRGLCEELRAIRRDGAREFDARVEAELRELAMEAAVFATAIEPREPDGSGADDVQFLFSANKGEPARPLSKIASGGEVSRVMLALKSVLAGRGGRSDPGLRRGGFRIGGTSGERRGPQVGSTRGQRTGDRHQPPRSDCGPSHVAFSYPQGPIWRPMVTEVRVLSSDERIEEVARMIAGEEVGQAALAQAKELLKGRV
ncbi:MAG: DNA replication and repair protein RecN [Armatimonadetes bacterium OLB18]|nr:MAG: DNA replication and repair protein RecN [Armatimonadetes bacterium OLB18]